MWEKEYQTQSSNKVMIFVSILSKIADLKKVSEKYTKIGVHF